MRIKRGKKDMKIRDINYKNYVFCTLLNNTILSNITASGETEINAKENETKHMMKHFSIKETLVRETLILKGQRNNKLLQGVVGND